MRRFHQLTNPDTIAVAKKTFVRISGPSKREKTTPSSSSPGSSVTINKTSAASGSKLPLQSPSSKKKSSSASAASGSKRKSSLKKKTAAIPTKKAKILDESNGEETETSTTTEESDYSLHDDSAEDDTPTEGESQDRNSSDVPSQLSETTRHWKEYYRKTSEQKTQRGYFLSQFYFFLMHGVGGSIREEQTLWHVRQDLSCLIRNDSMDIWTEFFQPNLDNGTLRGKTFPSVVEAAWPSG